MNRTETDTNMNYVPVWEKYSLNIEQAAGYFGLGEKKLRQIAADNPTADFILHNGSKLLFKRDKFSRFLDRTSSV